MDLKQEILLINTDDIQWEQPRIKAICKKLKGYSDTREKLEVALIHISKKEFELANKIITELKNAKDLEFVVIDDSKKSFVDTLILPFTMVFSKFSKKK